VQRQRRHQTGDGQIGPGRAVAKQPERGHENGHVADGVVARTQPHAAYVGITLFEGDLDQEHGGIDDQRDPENLALAGQIEDGLDLWGCVVAAMIGHGFPFGVRIGNPEAGCSILDELVSAAHGESCACHPA